MCVCFEHKYYKPVSQLKLMLYPRMIHDHLLRISATLMSREI